MKSIDLAVLRTVVGCIVSLLTALSLAVSAVLPGPVPPDVTAWHEDAAFTAAGHSVALPVATEREQRFGEKYARSIQLTLPVFVLEHGPVVYGIVILPGQDEASLASFFVYTQTTSSRF